MRTLYWRGSLKELQAALVISALFGVWLYFASRPQAHQDEENEAPVVYLNGSTTPSTPSAPGISSSDVGALPLNTSLNCTSMFCFFDATNLTAQDDVHTEKLLRIEESLASMRDFLVQYMVTPGATGDESSVEEMWELKPDLTVHNNTGDVAKVYKENRDPRHQRLMLFRALEYLWAMEFDFAHIKDTDAAMRKALDKLEKASEFVRVTLQHLQNPINCAGAHQLRCRVNNNVSLGAGLHDLLWCFVAGLQTGRMVVLDDAAWKHTKGLNEWTNAFLPLVEPLCQRIAAANGTVTEGYPSNGSTVALERRSIVDLPAALVQVLVVGHGDPYAWWFGHIMAYILRPSNVTENAIFEIKEKAGYKHPIVGVHVDGSGNRTLMMQNVAHCMRAAEEFYAKRDMLEAVPEKRVFVDTNRLEVLDLIRKKYPEFKVITSGPIVSSPVQNIVTMAVNVHLLAQADRLVCAFSSAWCRVAYELMQGLRGEEGGDATRDAVSVDVPYSYAGVPFPPRRVLYPNTHTPLDNELPWGLSALAWIQEDALPADETPGGAREKDGFPRGRLLEYTTTAGENGRHEQRGIYPRFKTTQVFSVAKYRLFRAAGRVIN